MDKLDLIRLSTAGSKHMTNKFYDMMHDLCMGQALHMAPISGHYRPTYIDAHTRMYARTHGHATAKQAQSTCT